MARRITPQKECAKNTLKIHSEEFYRMSNEKNLHINGSSHILFASYFFREYSPKIKLTPSRKPVENQVNHNVLYVNEDLKTQNNFYLI